MIFVSTKQINCVGPKCHHRTVVKNHPSLTIVAYLLDDVSPHVVAKTRLKVIAEAIVKQATMEGVSNLARQHINITYVRPVK